MNAVIEGLTAFSDPVVWLCMLLGIVLGMPGDSVMAVMIGSMMIWGIQPGPSLFRDRPEMVTTIAAIMIIAVLLSTVLSLVRTRGMVKLLDLPPKYLWTVILVFCIVGTYATTNSLFTVVVMLVAGVVGLVLKRAGFPAGPVVLGLLLGPLAEANLRRALVIGGPEILLSKPIAVVLFALAAFSLFAPMIGKARRARKAKAAATIDA